MAVLTVNNMSLSFGERLILKDITFEIQKGDRVGLVGVNGSGKTTLFKVLNGTYRPDAGGVVIAKDTRLGYMEQHVPNNMEKTAYEEVLTVFSDLMETEKTLEAVTNRLLDPLPEAEQAVLVAKQAALNEHLVSEGGLTFRNRVRTTLLGLGFTEPQLQNKVGVLSGGQKAKLQLAKLLLSGATLLLLDEPTNHLDIPSVEWLESFLADYQGAYLVVSHDRFFLDRVTNRTFELVHHCLDAYKGSYTKFLDLRAEKRLAMQRVYDSKQKEIKRIEGIIEQQRRWNQARNYVTIASKEKQIGRIAADMEAPERDPDVLKFRFHASRRSGDEVLAAKDLALSFDGIPLFHGVELDVRRGEKVFLVGPNGCGKTSLLKVLLKQYVPDAGFVKYGVGVDMGYYEQAQSGLHDEKTVIDEIWDIHPGLNQTEIRSALAIFLFRGEDVYKPVGALSGGERARLLLLKLMMSTTNFLLLDEPTNHLDIGSCEALERTLLDYDGTLFVVSHDRYLMNKLADKILELRPDGIGCYEGNYDGYLAAKQAGLAQALREKQPKREEKPNDYKLKKERDARLRKLRADLNQCEREIEDNEAELNRVTAELNTQEAASDYGRAMALSDEAEALQETADALLDTWAALSEELTALGKET